MKAFRVTAISVVVVMLLSGTAAAVGRQTGGTTNGVTADQIKIAYNDIDFEKLREVGAKIDRGDTQKIVDAVVGQINADGGINGRKLDVEVVKYNLLNPADAEAACVKMTEDLKVFAVINGFGGPAEGVTKCIPNHKTVLVGGNPVIATAQKSGWITADPTQERQAKMFVELLAKKGVLKGKKIGISTDTAQEQVTKKVIVPALKKAGASPKVVVVDDAPAGDTSAADANWDIFAEKFKSAGVNHVILVGNETSGGLTRMLDRGVKATVSSPTSGQVSTLGTSQTQRPPSAYDGIYSIMGLAPDEIFADPAMQKCVQQFEKANPSITVKKPSEVAEGETDWATGILTVCGQLGLFTKVAGGAGKNLSNLSFAQAAQKLTTNFALPGSPYNTLSPTKFDAPNGFRLAVYDHAQGKTGGLKPFGPIQNLG